MSNVEIAKILIFSLANTVDIFDKIPVKLNARGPTTSNIRQSSSISSLSIVMFDGKTIDDILNLTIDDAVAFFYENMVTKIATKLKPLQDVGLGYVTLGQSSSTLSGGEAQRIKLASFLVKGNTKDKALFIFDEPTTGLHFHDIKKLLASFNALIERGHSIIVIEHNMELVKCADYIIDLGLEGGKNGGKLIFQGTPEELARNNDSYTAKYLAEKLVF